MKTIIVLIPLFGALTALIIPIVIITRNTPRMKTAIYYLFHSREYPVRLYNLYGSEGHSPDREFVEAMIKVHGFWTALFMIQSKKEN